MVSCWPEVSETTLARGYTQLVESIVEEGGKSHAKSFRSSSPNHRSVVVAKRAKELPHFLLRRRAGIGIRCGEQSASRGSTGKPLSCRKSLDDRKEILFEILSRKQH